MEYISAEEFLKQPVEVQRTLKEYFDQELILYSFNNSVNYGVFDDIIDETPLLTEGQIRKFIEDKTGGIIRIEKYIGLTGYDIKTLNYRGDSFDNVIFENLGEDLLQAYWKVAIEIAKEGI